MHIALSVLGLKCYLPMNIMERNLFYTFISRHFDFDMLDSQDITYKKLKSICLLLSGLPS